MKNERKHTRLKTRFHLLRILIILFFEGETPGSAQKLISGSALSHHSCWGLREHARSWRSKLGWPPMNNFVTMSLTVTHCDSIKNNLIPPRSSQNVLASCKANVLPLQKNNHPKSLKRSSKCLRLSFMMLFQSDNSERTESTEKIRN